MKIPEIGEHCPESWRQSFIYDQMEVYGSKINKAYVYAYKNRFNTLIALVKKHAAPSSRILDIAAGSGNFTLTLATDGFNMVWNDLREELIPYVKMKQDGGSIKYMPGNIFEINDYGYDAIIISEVIEHMAHPDQFLKKVADMVKPGGYIFLSTPTGSYFLNKLPKFTTFSNPQIFEKKQFKPNADGHIFLLHLEELNTMGTYLGLELIENKFNNNPLSSGHIKLHYLLNIFPESWVRSIEQLTNAFPLWISKKIHANMVIVFKKN